MSLTKYIDRSGWPPGPWDTELDAYEWTTAAGLLACACRAARGHFCGYVRVPIGNPLHGVRDVEPATDALDVHGQITFGRELDQEWWLGFDCNHASDLSPNPNYNDGLRGPQHGEYRTIEYVREQCESLAKQIAALG